MYRIPVPRVDLRDPNLFGNDAAEDESADIFSSYVLERPEVRIFTDSSHSLRIVRAYKGEGKSALLRLAYMRVSSSDPDALVMQTTGPSLSPGLSSSDSDAWVRAWKQSIFKHIAGEVGTRIGMAWTDDAISLVEDAERNGYKSRSIVSAVIDRLKSSKVPVERTRPPEANHERVLQRWASRSPNVWLFIDDIDQNFENRSEVRARIAGVLTACRQVTNLVPQIRIRLAIRPNVWTAIRSESEALTHIDQYLIDMKWELADMRRLLARRIEGHLRRRGETQFIDKVPENLERDNDLISQIFESPMHWGAGKRPAEVVLTTLSRNRPRWLIELCKVGAEAALSQGQSQIRLEDLVSQLEPFGRRRITDTISEFKSQSSQVDEIIAAFMQQKEQYATNEIVELINRRVLQSVPVTISGVIGKPTAVDVAAFLFHIGFLTARKDFPDGTYEHISFSDRPELWRSRANMDQGMSWEIHPVFRQALGLRDAEGREVRRKR